MKRKCICIMYLALFCTLLFAGCAKEDKTFSYATIYNKSGVAIQVTLFSSGVPINYQINLEPNDSLLVSTDAYIGKGKGKNPGFNNEYFETADSVIVLFNDLYKVTHYRYPPVVLSPKHCLPANPRCIMNIGNWEFFYESSKHSIKNYYTYTFTKQDYQFARN